MSRRFCVFLLALLLSACSPADAAPTTLPPVDATALMAQALSTAVSEAAATARVNGNPTLTSPTPTPPGESNGVIADPVSATVVEIANQTPPAPSNPTEPAGTPTLDTRKLPKYWAEWPLIPTASARAKEIFLLGQQLGNDPHSFTTIGDCQSEPNILMGTYDIPGYLLPEGSAGLVETIQWFQGSFARDSITVKDGMSAASVFAPGWADPDQCQPKETPLECEFRLHKPAIVIISLGTNWRGGDEVKHAEYMRRIVDYAISKGVLPVLSTKGDNLEGGHRINESIAQVAYDYDLPLWNFWLSIRDLPGKGIDGSRPGGYLIPDAWGRRSYTGLQALD
ncbi:MAG: SGNH/GDSL hydrolase family protein, partial [Chloroflexi bacterium]